MAIDVPQIALNGKPTTVDGVPATTTLLDWLRDWARMRGTKEGCAEGDCGACAVVLESLTAGGHINRCVVNACLTMVGQVDGLGVRTVEGLVSSDGSLHPIQSALAAGAATQCGFCTPGFVMSAYAFATGREPAEVPLIHDALAGNLCRCTGYRPIVDAVMSAIPISDDPIEHDAQALRAALKKVSRNSGACFEFETERFYVPHSLRDALDLRAEHPQAVLLAGGTDLGLLVSQKRQRIPTVIHLGKVDELNVIIERENDLTFGASVTYTVAFDLLAKHYPAIRNYWTRIGSRQIRNMGTLGGNIGTASPIGDTLPILLALDARVILCSVARGHREIPANDFFVGYRKTVLAADELIVSITVPKASPGTMFFVDKISKRRDQDISSVCGAYWVKIEKGIVRDIRIAYGGLAATPKRAYAAERMLAGRQLNEGIVASASETLSKQFQPISDWRGSAEYRSLVAKNLLRRLSLRIVHSDVLVECDAL
jgi:xanthine dehydrogenase small subunit